MNKWATRVLYVLGGYALKWWLGGENVVEGDADAARRATRGPRRRPPTPTEELKLVLVVNDSLKMGKGKIGAQCAHAAVGIVDELHEQGKEILLAQWEECGQPKICLKAKDDVELRQLLAAAARVGLPTFIVQDAGRTQVSAGSRTVLAIGPAAKRKIDEVTGHLRLL